MRMLLRFMFVGAIVIGVAAVTPTFVSAQTPSGLKAAFDQYGDPLPDGAIARFGTVRFRNMWEGPIGISPDGRYFATNRNGLSVMDIVTGKLVRSFTTNGSTRRISFSPDGKWLVNLNDGDQAESIWVVDTGKKLRTIEGGGGVFVREGKALLQVERLNTGYTEIRLVDCDGKPIANYTPKHQESRWVESPSGNHVILGQGERTTLVDLVRSEEFDLGNFATSMGEFRGCTFFPDGKQMIVAGNKGIAIWDVETRKELRAWKEVRSDSPPVVSPDGKRIAWSGYDNNLGIAYPWAMDVNGDKPWRVGAATNSFTPPAFSYDGKELAVFDDGGALQFRDIVTGKDARPVVAHAGLVAGVRFTTDGKHLVTRDKNRVLVWDRSTTRLLRRYPDDLPDGERILNTITKTQSQILTLDRSDVLRLRDLVTGKVTLQLEGRFGFIGGAANPASISVDGQSAAVVDKDGDIRVYDLKSGKARFTLDPEAAVWSADLSADGRFLQVSTQGRKLSDRFIVDTTNGKEVAPDNLYPTESKHLGEPSEGRLHRLGFETMNWLSGARLLDATGEPIVLDGNFAGAEIYAPANARYIAVRTIRGKIGDEEPSVRLRIWDAGTKKLLTHFNPQKAYPELARFSPNGRLILLSGFGVLSVWEVATGRERIRFKGHFSGVTTIGFTPEGRGIFSGGDDSQVFLWDYTKRSPDGVWATTKLTREEQGAYWKSLASDDGAEAHRAIWELIADPEGTAKFLDGKLPAAKLPDQALLAKYIEKLGSNVFAERETATRELRTLGDMVLPQLRSARKKATDAELRERLDRIVQELERTAIANDQIQQVRAIEVLESIGTKESRQVLEKLARGEATSRLTREAKFALGR